MTDSRQERRWPWYQQVVDAIVLTLGVGIALAMTYRNSWPVTGVVLVVVCIGKLGASQAIRLLLGRWESKP